MSLINHLSQYVKSSAFRKYFLDWIVGIGLLVYFFVVAEHARPFQRQFKLNDYTIQHPFAHDERVTGIQCILLASIIPSLTITLVVILRLLQSKNINSRENLHNAYHLAQVSILGLMISLAVNGVFTDILKNWIARPRPDFLQRCGAPAETPVDVFVDASICTAPLGRGILMDGMRSTPSGHSSISFSGLGYLSLWLFGQFKLLHPGVQNHHAIYKYILSLLPVLLSIYVALSRVQDYRHHFSDIVLGSLIGIVFANLVYLKYFNPITSDKCDKVASYETDVDEAVLPIYNSVSDSS